MGDRPTRFARRCAPVASLPPAGPLLLLAPFLLATLLPTMLFGAPLGGTTAAAEENSADRNWPQWRGPLGTGVAPHADPPLHWSETENVRWKIALPGGGHSTPVVWGEHIFLTAAIPHGEALPPRYSNAPGAHDNSPVTHRHRFVVLAVRRSDGKVLWQREVGEDLPHEGGHFTASLASPSPATDGERVYASFGSQGLYCLDFEGKLLWKTGFGKMQTKHAHGEGASPALFGETLVVNWDHEGESFIVALDARSGAERWKRNRNEVTSWATPIVVAQEGGPQVIVSGTERIRGYDLATGRTVWECGGLSQNVVASPVAGDGMLYAGSSYDTRALLAIRIAGAEGDITGGDRVAWKRVRGTPYVPSPLLYDDALYFLRHYQGILTRLHAPSGTDRPGALRLDGIRNVYASPVGAAGRVYITDRDGVTLVISHTEIPRPLAQNRLDDSFNASAALIAGDLLLRGEKSLYCVAEEGKER